jgi:acetyl-CoA carboxylase carboxyltransferase component
MKRTSRKTERRQHGLKTRATGDAAAVPTLSNASKVSGLRGATEKILAQEADLRQGGGEAGQARQRKLGRLPVRERIERLLDKNSPWLEVGLWAAHGMYEDVGAIVAAGVVVGVGYVYDRPVMVVANDATVKAGAFFPMTCKKVLRAQKIAARCNLPLVYLVDSAGVFLPMQDEIFPDEDDFGRIFRNNAVLSAMGVPQYAAIMGNCVAGGAYLPVLCDKVLMTSGSELYLAGPALVKAAIGQEVSPEELGGATMHAQVSGTIDFHEKDDRSCLSRLRELIALLPRNAPAPAVGSAPPCDPDDLYDLVALDGREEYDARDLFNSVLDADSFIEYKPEYGKTLVCGYGAIAGIRLGVVASQRIRTKSTRGELQIGGVIYHDSADKAARFVMDCNQTQVPIVFFQDVQGFMVGRDAEQQGIIRSGAKLVNAVSNSTVPKITVIVGGSFGAGNYALGGKAFDPVFIFAWPSAKYAVMGADQAAGTLLQLAQRQAERAGRALSQEELDELRQVTRAGYQEQTDIRYGAARGWVDTIIAPDKTRDVLSEALRLATRLPPPGGFRAGVLQV